MDIILDFYLVTFIFVLYLVVIGRLIADPDKTVVILDRTVNVSLFTSATILAIICYVASFFLQ